MSDCVIECECECECEVVSHSLVALETIADELYVVFEVRILVPYLARQ